MEGSPFKFFPQATFVVVNLDNPAGADALRQSGSKNIVFKGCSRQRLTLSFILRDGRSLWSAVELVVFDFSGLSILFVPFEFYYLSI